MLGQGYGAYNELMRTAAGNASQLGSTALQGLGQALFHGTIQYVIDGAGAGQCCPDCLVCGMYVLCLGLQSHEQDEGVVVLRCRIGKPYGSRPAGLVECLRQCSGQPGFSAARCTSQRHIQNRHVWFIL